MYRMMPLNLVKNQILIYIIHYEIDFNNFLRCPWSSSAPFRTRTHAIYSPHWFLQWSSLHKSKLLYPIFCHLFFNKWLTNISSYTIILYLVLFYVPHIHLNILIPKTQIKAIAYGVTFLFFLLNREKVIREKTKLKQMPN